MSGPIYGRNGTGRRDANEPAIRRVVEEEFGGQFVPVAIRDGWDAIVGLAGVTELWEIKNGRGRISPGQKRWADEWTGGPSAFVHNEAQARKRCRMILERRPTLSTVLRAEHAVSGGGVDQAIEDDWRGCSCDRCHVGGKNPEEPA